MQAYLPVSGTSVGRITRRICSMLCKSGDKPPCIQKIFSSIIAAIGRQLKQSVNVFHSLMLYRRLPVEFDECFAGIYAKLTANNLTFIVKSIYTIYACIFVITTKNEKVFRILDFV
jgi:phosphatidylinositol kinase/protein kinase (PI-3  family)